MTGDVIDVRRELLKERGLADHRLPSPVERSWERCLRSGINAHDDRLFQSLPGTAQIRRIEDEYRNFIAIAIPQMKDLLKTTSGSNWCVLCTSASGMVIKSIASSWTPPAALQVIMVPGKGISESEIGTTAPGCALIDLKPVRVDRGEHFLDSTGDFVCAAAPFFDPHGELAGVLDLSGVGVRGYAGMLELVELSAQTIENQMVLKGEGDIKLRVHYRADMLDSPRTGLISFSSDGKIVGANSVGRRLLSLGKGVSETDVFEQLFEGKFGSLMDMSRNGDGRGSLRTVAGQHVSIAIESTNVRSHSHYAQARARVSIASAKSDNRSILTDEEYRQAFDRACRVYASHVPVMVQGETGTGKEVFARSLHETSARRNGPFVAVDCSAMPANLIEAELFGYEEGAFTSARRGGARGKIESANKGTLFLDEIGDMPFDLQTRLLRVLQERVVTRIGSTRAIPVDFGLISATHRSIEQMVEQNTFRQDLFFRLKGFSVTLPALRDRSDLTALIVHFLKKARYESREYRLSDAADQLLHQYSWPGNIRELEHVVTVACALAEDDGVILPDYLPSEIRVGSTAAPMDGTYPSGARQQDAVRKALEENGYNVSAASRSLGIARTTLYRRLNKNNH